MAIFISGKNPVREAVRAKEASRIYASSRLAHDPILQQAEEAGIPVEIVGEEKLVSLCKAPNHQGIVAAIRGLETCTLSALLEGCQKKKYPLILMLDGIEDPHNLGAMLRSCDAFGVDGIIMKKRGEVPLTPTVAKVSTGAIHYVKVAAVSNLSSAMETLKKNGFWIVAADGGASQSYADVDYRCPICLIVGSEGFGISRLVLKNSDFIVKIPMVGHVNSLNVSVAAGILLSQIALARQQ